MCAIWDDMIAALVVERADHRWWEAKKRALFDDRAVVCEHRRDLMAADFELVSRSKRGQQ